MGRSVQRLRNRLARRELRADRAVPVALQPQQQPQQQPLLHAPTVRDAQQETSPPSANSKPRATWPAGRSLYRNQLLQALTGGTMV